MSLFKFNITGLLSKETTFILNYMKDNYDWKDIENKLFDYGLTSSRKRSYVIVHQIKKRINKKFDNLPCIEDLIHLANSKVSSLTKSQVYYVFLYNSDKIFSNIMDSIFQIYDHNKKNPVITRSDVKSLLINYLNYFDKEFNEKTKQNWIGKFISILKEINMFIERGRHTYLINIGEITYETWTFFTLHTIINNYDLNEALFIKAFHILPSHIQLIIKRGKNRNWITYNTSKFDGNKINITLKSNFKNIKEWLERIN